MNDQFILGGYYVIKAAKRAECLNSDLLPEKIFTISNCICDNFLSRWWDKTWWKNQSETENESMFNNEELEQLENWVKSQFDMGNIYLNYGFNDLRTAREFCEKFLRIKDDVYILGIGLSSDEKKIFLTEEEPAGAQKPCYICCFGKK